MVHLQTGFNLISSDLLQRVRGHLVAQSSDMVVMTVESVVVVLVSIARIICQIALRCRQHDRGSIACCVETHWILEQHLAI